MEKKKNILILGASFGGIKAAKALEENLHRDAKRQLQITMLNRRNYHLYTPFLYQAATGLVEFDDLAQPLRLKANNLGFKFVETEIESIDLVGNKVQTNTGQYSYDYLVMALGSVKNDGIIKGAKEHSIALKTLEDANRIHNRIISSFEKAVILPKGPKRNSLLSFVIIGGSTGVELAGAIRDYTRLLQKFYPEIDFREECRVYVIEAHERLFPSGDERLSMLVKRTLEERGVNVILNTKVANIEEGKVNLPDGRSIQSENIFFNAGTRPCPVLESIPENLVKKAKGRIVVDQYLRIPNFHNVFAVGDIAHFEPTSSNPDHSGSPPATAETAVEMGNYCGKYLAVQLNGLKSTAENRDQNVPAFHYKERGTMLSVGVHNAIAQLPQGTFTGLAGWLIWRMVHLYSVNTLQGKLRVIFDWTLGSFHRRNISHLD